MAHCRVCCRKCLYPSSTTPFARRCIEMLATLSTFHIYSFALDGDRVATIHVKVKLEAKQTTIIPRQFNVFFVLLQVTAAVQWSFNAMINVSNWPVSLVGVSVVRNPISPVCTRGYLNSETGSIKYCNFKKASKRQSKGATLNQIIYYVYVDYGDSEYIRFIYFQ